MTARKEKAYRALSRGECPVGHWHKPGDVFSTDLPQGRWMEEISPKEAAKADD